MIKKSTYFILGVQGFIAVCSLLHYFSLTRYLGLGLYGSYAVIISICRFVEPLNLMGRYLQILEYPSKSSSLGGLRRFAQQKFISILFSSALLALICAPFVLKMYSIQSPLFLIVLIMFNEAFAIQITRVYNSYLFAREKNVQAVSLNLLIEIFRISPVLILMFFSVQDERLFWIAIAKLPFSLLLLCLAIFGLSLWRDLNWDSFKSSIIEKLTKAKLLLTVVNFTDQMNKSLLILIFALFYSSNDQSQVIVALQIVFFASVYFSVLLQIKRKQFFISGKVSAYNILVQHFSYLLKFFILSCLGFVLLYFFARFVPLIIGREFQGAVVYIRWVSVLLPLIALDSALKNALVCSNNSQFRIVACFTGLLLFLLIGWGITTLFEGKFYIFIALYLYFIAQIVLQVLFVFKEKSSNIFRVKGAQL